MSSINQANKGVALRRSGSDSSIIPDSEPEPELLGANSRSSSPPRPPITATKKGAVEIIELSSDSGESLEFEMGPGLVVLSGTSNHRNTDGFRSIHELDGQDSDGPCDSPRRRNKLSRFAFEQPQSKPRPTPSTSFQSSRARTTIDQSDPNLDYSHTKEELRHLSRCVVCDMVWTTKKTVAMKLDHIRKCGKKNAFTDEAIRTRIIQELSKPVEVNDTTEDPKSPEKIPTLMENILKDTQPKNRGKRKEITTTVVKIQPRHEIFHARAEVLFAFSQNENQKSESQLSHTSKAPTANCSKASPFVHKYPASKLGTRADYDLDFDDQLEPTDISRGGDAQPLKLTTSIPLKRKRDVSLLDEFDGFSPPWVQL